MRQFKFLSNLELCFSIKLNFEKDLLKKFFKLSSNWMNMKWTSLQLSSKGICLKGFQIEFELDEDTQFKGDETDFMELCGNLLDNACKAATNRIIVSASKRAGWLTIKVEDDGPGIPDDKKVLLLERGTRLDTYTEGHGIGMALAADLVSIYEGRMLIEDSSLGGARIVIQFPNHE